MTEVASGVPTQSSAATDSAPAAEPVAAAPSAEPVAAAPSAEPAVAAPVTEPVATAPVAAESTVEHGTIRDRAHEAVERAGERAQEVMERAGERAGEVAAQVGDAVERAAQASGRMASAMVDRLRNNAELAAERGSTTIANEVVEKIAGIAARDVPGVYDLGGDVARIFAAVKERVGLGDADEDADRGVRVRLDGGVAVITITIVIEFGFVVHSVTEKVRAKVISSVENLLGLEVARVDIVVDDVHMDDSGPVGNDETRAANYA